jgi:hypothetical protein
MGISSGMKKQKAYQWRGTFDMPCLGEDMESCSVEFPTEAFTDLIEKKKNGKWLDENFKSLQIKMPNMFIAIYRASLLDTAETLDELFAQIEEMDIDNISQIVIGFIPEEDLVFIL